MIHYFRDGFSETRWVILITLLLLLFFTNFSFKLSFVFWLTFPSSFQIYSSLSWFVSYIFSISRWVAFLTLWSLCSAFLNSCLNIFSLTPSALSSLSRLVSSSKHGATDLMFLVVGSISATIYRTLEHSQIMKACFIKTFALFFMSELLLLSLLNSIAIIWYASWSLATWQDKVNFSKKLEKKSSSFNTRGALLHYTITTLTHLLITSTKPNSLFRCSPSMSKSNFSMTSESFLVSRLNMQSAAFAPKDYSLNYFILRTWSTLIDSWVHLNFASSYALWSLSPGLHSMSKLSSYSFNFKKVCDRSSCLLVFGNIF